MKTRSEATAVQIAWADALDHAYRVPGFEDAADGDDVFRQLVLAWIIEPVSKLDSLRVLDEAGIPAASYRTVTAPAQVP